MHISLLTHPDSAVTPFPGRLKSDTWLQTCVSALWGKIFSFSTHHKTPQDNDLVLSYYPNLRKKLEVNLLKAIKKGEDLSKVLRQISKTMPLEQIEKVVRLKHPHHESAIKTAQNMLRQAQIYLKKIETPSSFSMRAYVITLLDTVLATVENLISAFGVGELFKAADDEAQADQKFQKFMTSISLLSLMSSTLLPVLGLQVASQIMGGLILLNIGLSLLYPHIRPMPSTLPAQARNLSHEYLKGCLDVVEGRKHVLDQIADTFASSQKSRKHVMLIGKTRVGKTECPKALVKALERGDYPGLKGKTVFYINTANLINGGNKKSESGNDVIRKVSEAMGRHRENIILVLDEIHLACNADTKNAPLSEKLKTMLDAGKGKFPYVIGITTEVEFFRDIWVNNLAFAERFKTITVENTEDEETLEIVQNIFLQSKSNALVDPDAFKHLIAETQKHFPQDAQPHKTMRIFAQCMQRLSEEKKTTSQKRIEEIKIQMQRLNTKNCIPNENHLLTHAMAEYAKEITKLEKELKTQNNNLQEQKEALKSLESNKQKLYQLKLKMYQHVIKICQARTKNESDLKELLLLTYLLLPSLDEHVREQANTLGIPIIFNCQLIDEVIAGEVASNEKAQRSIEMGKIDLARRGANLPPTPILGAMLTPALGPTPAPDMG